MLISADAGLLPVSSNTAQVNPDGTFEIRDVLPGHYSAQLILPNDAGQVQMSVVGNVDVTDADLEHVQLSEKPPSTIAGTLRVEGQPASPAAKYYVALASSGDSAPMGFPSRTGVHKDGSFEFSNVPSGTYQVMVWVESIKKPDIFVKSVSLGGREITAEGLVVRGGSYRVDVVASTECARIQGAVTDDHGQPSPDATVVAVPDGELRNRADAYGIATSDQYGRFQISGMMPGKYTIVAAQDPDEDYRDPEFLQKYSGVGAVVRMSQGEDKSISLKLQTPSDD